MSFDWWTLALQVVNFAILVWLLQRFLYKPVLRIIDARRAEVDRGFSEAEAAKQAAENDRKLAATERGAIDGERTAALKAAAAQAEAAAAARRHQAEREADELMNAARKMLADERKAANTDLRREALDLGIGVARRLLEEIPPALRAEAWLERIEQHLAGLAPEERASLRAGLDSGEHLRVITATALPEDDRSEWRRRLKLALGNHLAIDFSTDPALIAGAELHFTGAILRFSWRDALAAMQTELSGDDHSA